MNVPGSGRGRKGGTVTNLDTFERYLTEDEWKYQREESYVRLGFTGENGNWRVFCAADDDGVIAVTSCLDTFIPEGRRLELSVLFSWINFKIRVGGFQLDPTDGEVRFRNAYDVEGGEFTQTMFRNMLGCNLSTMDHWLPTIMAVGYGGVAAEVAYEQAVAEHQAGL